MKLRTNKTIITLAATFFAVALLSACGDEITEITNSGLQSVASVKDLGKCTNKNEGDVVYVKGTVYLCADSTWKEMEFSGNEVKGKNGSNGENGTYCIVSALKDNSGYDIICDGEKIGTLLNGDDGERTYPFARQQCLENLQNFFGTSVVERIIPVQRAYNAVKNRKHEFMNRIALGVLAVEDGSCDTDDLEEEGLPPGKILVYRQGSTPPIMLSPGQIPAEFSRE